MNQKRKAREFCFQYFFRMQLPIFRELRQELALDQSNTLNESVSELKESTNDIFSDELNSFILKQVKSTLLNYEEIEKIATENLKNWKLNRLSRVDNTVLLLAINEICFTKDNPINIIINEAIEISKKFGSSESASFINGVLDSVAKKYNSKS